MMETITSKAVKIILSAGYVEVSPSRSRKYRQFQPGNGDKEFTYWVGKSGAVRVGPTSSASMSVTATFKKEIAKRG